MSGTTHSPPTEAPLLPVNHRADRPLRIVLTVMAFLAALALLGSRMATQAYQTVETDLAGFATVQILPSTPSMRSAATDKALMALADFTTETIRDADAKALLRPWLGDTPLPDGIALPVLIRVETGSAAQSQALAQIMAETGLNYTIENHDRWQSELSRTGSRIGWLSSLILLVIVGASMASTVFATQSALASERQTVDVFTQVGASDSFIGTLFVRRALRLGGTAAILGVVLAAVLAVILSVLGRAGGSTFVPKLSFAMSDILALLVLAFVLTGFGALAAGATVRQILRDGRRAA